jgi:tripartite ATP-independent transporter DctM subunit
VAFKRAFLVLLTPVIIIGGIFGGIFTPTEAATVAVLYVLALGMFYRRAAWRAIYREFVSAGATVGVLLLVVGLSGVDGWIFTYQQLPVVFADAVSGVVESRWAVMLLLLGIVLVLGMFMDATPVILMAAPVMLPLVKNAGLDPVHFGALFCIMCVIGLVTPPVGVALYGVATVSRLPMERVFWAMLPFFMALLAGVIVLVFVPQIVTYLPSLLIK